MALTALTTRLSGRHVAVIGDVMLDHFVVGRVERISPEAPVPVVRFERDEYRLGGAANVAHNVRALGGLVTLVGLVGADEISNHLRSELAARGIGHEQLVTDSARQTTRKTRVVTARNQQVARIDYETDSEPSVEVSGALVTAASMAIGAADAVVLSDYRKGVVSPAIIAAVSAACKAARKPLLVDPKIPIASRYVGATLLTPNHHEAEMMTGVAIRTIDDARLAARTISEGTGGASVLITWGEHGMWLLDTSSGGQPREDTIPAAAREVSDVTGAGDTVIATLALALAAGASLGDAARLATIAAGLVVARFGPATTTLAEIQSLI